MKITYYGHSCFELNAGGKIVLIDPFITGNELAAHINIKSLHPDFILLSHGHADHTLDAVPIAKQSHAMIISNWEIASWAARQDVKTHPMNTGGGRQFDFGHLKFVSAIHSSVLPDGTYGGNPMGMIIDDGEKSIYYSGDTALTLDMQLVPKFKIIDLAVFPVGDNFTMGIEDAIEAAKLCQVTRVMGVHFDTFGYIKIDHASAINKFKENGIELILPKIGDQITV